MQDIEKFSNEYFAKKEGKECAGVLLEKANSFFQRLTANAYLDKIMRMWDFYHGIYSDDNHSISFTGEQGELVNLPVNHFRNLAQHMLNIITSNRPIMEARAVNTDYKSLAQTYLCNGILDYYMREKGLEDVLKKAVEYSIVLGSGFVKLEWNATAGEVYEVDDYDVPTHEGEVEFSILSPFDVIVDGTKDTWNNEWIMTRTFINRYNLMAKYPEHAEKLSQIEAKDGNKFSRLNYFSNDCTEDIPVYEFYHKKTEALPDGRYILFASTDIVLMDMKLPYRVLPIFRITPGEILGTPYGYTPMFDIYPIQEMLNSSYSAIASNQNAFAVQNVFVQRGADLTVSQLHGSLNVIEGNAKPEPLNLAETPAEVFKFIQDLIQQAETLSGINSVTRGNPEASLESGTALALVQAMSLQFISNLQQSYVKLVEAVGTGLVNILKDYATTPKLVALVGRNNRPLLKEFTGDMISDINRVIVDVGNPLSRSIAGRVQMAEQLAQMKLLKNPQQYFQVMNTGRLDVMFEGEVNEMLLIRKENEQLLEGEEPIVSILDDHRMHIMEHKSVISDPDLRTDPIRAKAANTHIQEHIKLLREGDPDLLQLLGQQPLNNPQTPPGPTLPPGPMQNQEVLQGSPMGDVQGLPPMGQEMIGNVGVPNVPSPPAPFENMPVLPEQMM